MFFYQSFDCPNCEYISTPKGYDITNIDLIVKILMHGFKETVYHNAFKKEFIRKRIPFLEKNKVKVESNSILLYRQNNYEF